MEDGEDDDGEQRSGIGADCLSVDYVDAVGEDVLHQSAVHDFLGIEFLVEDGYLMAHLF